MIGQEEIRTLADYNQNWIVLNPQYALHIQITFGFVHSFVGVKLFKFRHVVVGLLFCSGPSNLLVANDLCDWIIHPTLDHPPDWLVYLWVEFGPTFGPYENGVIWYFVTPTSTLPQPNQPPLLKNIPTSSARPARRKSSKSSGSTVLNGTSACDRDMVATLEHGGILNGI